MPIPEDPVTSQNPQTPESASETDGWLDDAPGGDRELDELFALSDPTLEPGGDPEPVAEPQAPQPFLQGKYTKYASQEEAIRGTDEKDLVIERIKQNREQIAEALGADPITGKVYQATTNATPASTPQAPASPPSYLEDPVSYVKALQDAVNKDDAAAFQNVQRQLIREEFNQGMQPVVPLMTDFARERAIGSTGQDPSAVNEFLQSDEYRQTLEDNPILKDAIQLAESNVEAYGQLGGLYKLAHQASQGQKVKAEATPTGAPAPVPTPKPRPTTVSASTPAPPTPGGQAPGFDTPEGRQEIIRRLEQGGVGDITI